MLAQGSTPTGGLRYECTRHRRSAARKAEGAAPERLGQIADFVDFLAAQERRRQAGEALREMWSRMPNEVLTEEIEQEIVEEVRAVRAERRKRGAT